MRPRRTCGFVLCFVLAGTSEGLTSLRVLEGAHCRCYGTELSCGIVIVEIFHSGEGGDVEQVARTSKQFCMFAIAHLSLNSLVFMSCMLIIYVLIYYMLDIYLCAIDIYAWDCLISYMLSYCSHLYMLDIVCICAHTSIQPRKL